MIDRNELLRRGTLKITWNTPIISCNKKSETLVVIPVYKKADTLSKFEEKSIENTISVLGGNYDISLICPKEINVAEYKEKFKYDFNYFKVSNDYFVSKKSYSDLCENYNFYELFSDYEYILICQPDAWIFNDNLDYFIKLGYDYIGAVHMLKANGTGGRVGNGGFSLRKVSKFIEVCKRTDFEKFTFSLLEDVIFSSRLGGEFNIADLNTGFLFGWQEYPEKAIERAGKLPMGCHNPMRNNWNFWRNYIKLTDDEADERRIAAITGGSNFAIRPKYDRNKLKK